MSIGLGFSMNGVDLSDRVSFEGFSWEEILGSAGTATVSLEFLDDTVFIEKLADIRIYKGSLNLFHGRCLSVELERIGTAAKAHLTVEDYNGLFEQVLVGAPAGDVFDVQADGTALAVDGAALNYGGAHYMTDYWPLPGLPPGIDLTTFYDTSLAPPTLPVRYDRYTAMTTLGAVLQDDAAHVSGAVRFWIDPDYAYHWAAVAPTDFSIGIGSTGTPAEQLAQQFASLFPAASGMTFAPYAIGDTLDEPGGTVVPMRMSVRWDWGQLRESVYVRGSTLPGSGWVGAGEAGVFPWVAGGREYVDAPGSIYAEDKLAIGIWNLRQNYRELLTGSASIPPGFDGWRVGQVVTISDPVLSQLYGHDLSGRALTIQSVRGTLKVPAQDNADQTVGDIEYNLEFGDIPSGSMARQLEQIPEPEPPKVIYRFLVTIADPSMPPGQSCAVSAQLADGAGAAVQMAGVPMEWVVISWDVDASPATGVSLADDVGTTDAGGRVFTTLTLAADSTAKSIEVSALALPIG